MKPEMAPIIPEQQVLISFAGHNFLAVRLSGGRIGVVFRHFCEALDLNLRGQTQRIQENPTLSKNFLPVVIKTPGGPQVVNVLLTTVLSLWLGGFRLGRLSEEKRRLIIMLQEEAEAAFSRPFMATPIEPPQQPKAPQPPPAPVSAPDVASLSVYDLFHLLVDRMEQKDLEMQGELARIDRQQAEDVAKLVEMQRELQLQREQVAVLWSVLLGRASVGAGALSADHQQTLRLLMDLYHRMSGQPLEAIRRELLLLVGAVDLGHLQETDWKQIVAWFAQRLA